MTAPSPIQINLEQVVERLSRQVGALSAELAMRDVALDAAQARISELEQAAAQQTAAEQHAP